MIDTGDTAWVLICSALVLLMTPGLAFFYAGLVREKSAVNTIKMSFIALAVIAIEWAVVGYSMALGHGNAFLGGAEWFGLSGVGAEPNADYAATIPHLAYMLFQMMFAIITPALISGAVVGRMKFKAYVAFILLWSLLVYNPLAHWVWGPEGWIAALGALDFAGGTVVHVSAGVSALVAAKMLGPRSEFVEGWSRGEPTSEPHNVPFVVLGASLLWFGWFGFNAGSSLAADGLAAGAVVTTMLSASAAVAAWAFLDQVSSRKPTAVNAAIAAVVGLVGITPAAGFVTPMAAVAIGALCAAASHFALRFLERTKLDDTLDVFACHGVGGVVGALLTGVFASAEVNPAGADGLLYGNPSLLFAQAVSVLAAAGLSVVGTATVLSLLRATIGLRPSLDEERLGIDVIEHNEAAYVLGELKARPGR